MILGGMDNRMEFITGKNEVDLFENLVESQNLTVTHLALDKGQVVPQHFVDANVVVVPVKGKVEFYKEDGSFQVIQAGMIVTMNPNEKHSLKALEKADIMVIKMHLK